MPLHSLPWWATMGNMWDLWMRDKYRCVQTKQTKISPPEDVEKPVPLDTSALRGRTTLRFALTSHRRMNKRLTGSSSLPQPAVPQHWHRVLHPGSHLGWPAAGWVWQSRGGYGSALQPGEASLAGTRVAASTLLSCSLAPRSHPYSVLKHSCLGPMCWGHECIPLCMALHDAVSFIVEAAISEAFWLSIIAGMVIPDTRAGGRQLLMGRHHQFFLYYKFSVVCSPLCRVGWRTAPSLANKSLAANVQKLGHLWGCSLCAFAAAVLSHKVYTFLK